MEAAAPARPRPTGFALPGRDALAWPLAALALMAALHLDIALNRAVNWDEFFHYSQVRTFRAGGWLDPLQTLHARLFAWAAELPGNAVEHIRAIRPVIYGFVLLAALAIFLMAERFAARGPALTCALLYLSSGFVLQHGASFRADAMVAALLMAALALLLRVRLGAAAIVAIGLLCAIATLETIKAVLYAPAFLGIAWLRWAESGYDRRTMARLAAVPAAAVALFGLLYLAHGQALGDAAAASEAATQVVARSGRKMFALGGLPYYVFILKAALLALVFAVCVVIAPGLIARRGGSGARKVALAGLWLPICVLGFYHNTAPYFYVFILPPVAVACAPAAAWLIERYSLRALACLLAVSGLAVWAIEDRQAQSKQRAVLGAAEAIFAGPVAYFDFPAMLGGWPKANHFMTPWGQDAYLGGGAPSFRAIMQARTVPLVVEIEPMFERLYAGAGPTPYFLPADAAALRENYVSFWGPFRLAGREVPAGAPARTTEFLVPGPYTVVGGAVLLDGRRLAPGSVVPIARGPHALRAIGPEDARLIWGDRLREPASPPPDPPYWAEF